MEIDKFHLEEEGEVQEKLIEISDSKGKLDRASATHSLKLIVARTDPSFEEDERMDLNLRRGLKDLLAERSKRSSSKEAPKSQVPANLPPPPPLPTTTLNLLRCPDLKKKRKMQEVKEGEMWVEALNLVGVPTNSEWRLLGSVYYHPEIREVPASFPSPSALAPKSLE